MGDLAMPAESLPLVAVENLKVHFPITRGILVSRQVGVVRAVDGVSFEIRRGQTLGLVGESGCGKSTTGRAILQLLRPTSGRVLFEGTDLTTLGQHELRMLRTRMQMIFQDSYAALNPRHSVGKIVGEPLRLHGVARGRVLDERVCDLLGLVGLNPMHRKRYPHEFSGGQRQRIGTARALALNPSLIICDEPISALDVSIQAQIANLLVELQQRLGLTYLFIAHDLSMVRHISDHVAVMYLGKIVELADRVELFANPLHPYTQALISAVPLPDPGTERQRRAIILVGELPSPVNPPRGCVFSTRCPQAQDVCHQLVPEYREVRPRHQVACHLVIPEADLRLQVSSG
jgi:oligopeptide transport system ATP-binding protein